MSADVVAPLSVVALDLEWEPAGHAPATDGRRRTMHGVTVASCGLQLDRDQYDPASLHLPHLAVDGSYWCPGYATEKVPCPAAVVDPDGHATGGHGAHAWPVSAGAVLWCRGYRSSHAGLAWGHEDGWDDPRGERADEAAARQHEGRWIG